MINLLKCQTCLRPNPKNVKTHINILPERVELVMMCDRCRRKHLGKRTKDKRGHGSLRGIRQ